jgi:hypothetical protein
MGAGKGHLVRDHRSVAIIARQNRWGVPLLALACLMVQAPLGGVPAQAQAIITVPPPAAPVQAPQGQAPDHETKTTTTSTERKGKTASDIFLGVYLSLDKDCKIGASPKLDFPKPAQNGKVFTRNFPINLRDVPGAPRRTCIGTSPSGMAVIYRSAPKFKGEENIIFKLTYPNGDVREVSAKVIVQ